MKLELNGGLKCGSCIARLAKNRNTLPKCFSVPCPSSELMTEDLSAVVDFYLMLRSETLAPAIPMILRKARVSEEEIEIISAMDGVVNKWRKDQAES